MNNGLFRFVMLDRLRRGGNDFGKLTKVMVDSGSRGFIFEQLVFVLIEFRRKSISFCHLKSANFCGIIYLFKSVFSTNDQKD